MTGTITVTAPAPAAGITYSIDGTDYTNTTGVFTGVDPGTYNVTYDNGACISAAAPVTINPAPTAPAAPTAAGLTYCQDATAAPLTATGTNLLWYTTATGGTGSATAPTPSTAAAGTTSYWVSQTVGGCESPRTQVDVTVTASPAAPTAADATYCQDATASALTATGTNLLWYTTATGGTGSATSTNSFYCCCRNNFLLGESNCGWL